MTQREDVTRLLFAARTGAPPAFEALLPLVYDELHDLAHRQLGRFRPGYTINTTALVHEAYLRLVDQTHATYRDRHHFFAVAARAMRQIVVDYARQRRAQKRGGGQPVFAFQDDLDAPGLRSEEQADALVALDEALTRLAALDARLVRVVELRFFAGLSVEETAEVLAISPATIKRDTRAARAFLFHQMQQWSLPRSAS
jgi:RNA polymerase sigma factor (TIGR02999 family)